MPKPPNAFFLFMKDRKSAFEEAGMEFPNGYADMVKVEQLSNEWKELPDVQKKKYKELAAKLKNKNNQPKTEDNEGGPYFVDVRGRTSTGSGSTCDREIGKPSVGDQTPATSKVCGIRKEVDNLFFGPKANWRNQTIVICSFLDYFGIKRDQTPGWRIVLPAEIGLAAFSLSRGVVDNYGRVIDPGESAFPRGFKVNIDAAVKEYGLPPSNSVPDFKDLDHLQLCFERFLERYGTIINEGPPKEYAVFACNADIEMVQRCINMLASVITLKMKVRVLSLSYWTHVASNQSIRLLVDDSKANDAGLRVASNRKKNKAFNPIFVYPDRDQYPLASCGIFRDDSEVDEIILKSDNYRYQPELCCVYHYKKSDGIQHCALNKSNRLAYSILEYLTLSNRVVKILPGYHYPQLDNPKNEKDRRHIWLMDNWMITKYESMMEEPVKGETIYYVMSDDPVACNDMSQQNFPPEMYEHHETAPASITKARQSSRNPYSGNVPSFYTTLALKK